jgi:hypothetical protein
MGYIPVVIFLFIVFISTNFSSSRIHSRNEFILYSAMSTLSERLMNPFSLYLFPHSSVIVYNVSGFNRITGYDIV